MIKAVAPVPKKGAARLAWVIYTVPLGNAPVTDFGAVPAITGGDVSAPPPA